MKYADTGMGGRYKSTQNYLKETREDGSEFIRFTPVPPYETEPCIEAICNEYRKIIEEHEIDPLLILPVFIHDFLCVHPFNDGNGRMSRLLTLLLLYRSGYEVGKYISIEKHIEKTKGAYYDVLEEVLLMLQLNKKNHRLRFGEVPIDFQKRMYGESKRRLLPYIITFISTLIRLFFVRVRAGFPKRKK